MLPLRLVMMGTGEFAEPTFRALYDTLHSVVALVTQPDRSGPGRHRHHVNPLKRLAEERGTPVLQPLNVNGPGALADLRALNAGIRRNEGLEHSRAHDPVESRMSRGGRNS